MAFTNIFEGSSFPLKNVGITPLPLSTEDRRRAVRYVVKHAGGEPEDRRELLDMLGLLDTATEMRSEAS
jgi:hypothetical protein